MSKAFKKFIETADKGAKKKERIRQEKKKIRQEKKEYFERKKADERGRRSEGRGPKSEVRSQRSEAMDQKPEFRSPKPEARGQRPAARGQKPADSYRDRGPKSESRTQRPEGRAQKRAGGNKFRPQTDAARKFPSTKPAIGPKQLTIGKSPVPKPATDNKQKVSITKNTSKDNQLTYPKPQPGKKQIAAEPAASAKASAARVQMPLNKFIAHAGICSRRDAAEIVKSGKVVVNGQLIMEPGFKVTQQDEVKVNGKQITARKNLVYILLNKPKDFITTTEDPEGRKTVLDIVKHATTERVYPIGRLDRNTTGVLLLTNDGELAQKLAHPSYQVKKIYEVKLDKPLAKKDFDTIINGVTLEDGFIAPDVLAYADTKDKSIIGIEIHSGRNRIVRRIFEQLGYDVRNLDRVMYANLTKKNVERGKWRMLTDKEIRLLKFLNASYTRK
jgi:23S rRNA pseudouridine2605 synthase